MKNANQFLHFISNPAINGNDLEWVAHTAKKGFRTSQESSES